MAIPKVKYGRQRQGLEQTIAVLSADTSTYVPPHLIEIARGLADAVDKDPSRDRLWSQYRAAAADLASYSNPGSADEFAVFLQELANDLSPNE
jgi:hypothetical protein